MICVDLGSNTLRACEIGADLEVSRSFERIVGSARNMNSCGLAKDAMERIKFGISELCAEFDFSGGYFAAATEAFRISPNARAFFDEIEREFGIEFEIISGKNEAEFTRLGILNRARKIGLGDDFMSIDLGGASTEICYGGECESFAFGIVKFAQYSDVSVQAACDITAAARKFMVKSPYETIVLTSGVPTTIAALKIGLNYDNYDATAINGLRLEFADFKAAYEKIANSSNPDVLVGKNRADILLAGILLLEALLAGKHEFIVIDDGLREGLGVACARKILKLKEKNTR